jgi:hypothetical protein
MSIINFFELKEKFEIQPYRSVKKLEEGSHVPFSGSPRKHPFDKTRVILVADPFTDNTFYYEFKAGDITCAEELPNITNAKGESIPMARVWVKKHSVAIQSTPFIVDTIQYA